MMMAMMGGGSAKRGAQAQSALARATDRAYKDAETVMADQKDLVETRAILRQVVNYKG